MIQSVYTSMNMHLSAYGGTLETCEISLSPRYPCVMALIPSTLGETEARRDVNLLALVVLTDIKDYPVHSISVLKRTGEAPESNRVAEVSLQRFGTGAVRQRFH